MICKCLLDCLNCLKIERRWEFFYGWIKILFKAVDFNLWIIFHKVNLRESSVKYSRFSIEIPHLFYSLKKPFLTNFVIFVYNKFLINEFVFSKCVFVKFTEELVRRLPLENLKIHKKSPRNSNKLLMYDYGLLSLNKSFDIDSFFLWKQILIKILAVDKKK